MAFHRDKPDKAGCTTTFYTFFYPALPGAPAGRGEPPRDASRCCLVFWLSGFLVHCAGSLCIYGGDTFLSGAGERKRDNSGCAEATSRYT